MYCQRLDIVISDYECQQIQEQGQAECEGCPCYIPFIMCMLNSEGLGYGGKQ